MRKLIAGICLGCAVTSQAGAFDAWDFRSGMSPQQVAAVAARQGYDAAVPSTAQTPWTQDIAYSKRLPSGTYELGYIAEFCDGRLIWLSHSYTATNLGTVFELLNELTPLYGRPTARTDSNVLTGGRARSIIFDFAPKPDDAVSIGVSLTLQSDTDFGIQVIRGTHLPARCH